jgi:CCR4-NOT transcription complex subunit 6
VMQTKRFIFLFFFLFVFRFFCRCLCVGAGQEEARMEDPQQQQARSDKHEREAGTVEAEPAEVEAEEIKIATWNVLAQAYCRSELFPASLRPALRQKQRQKAAANIIHHLKPHIICLQEVDFFEEFWVPLMARHGLVGISKSRGHHKKDCLAFFYHTDKFELQEVIEVEFNELANSKTLSVDLGGRNDAVVDPSRFMQHNVGLIVQLRCLKTGRSFRVATAHLFWDPEHNDVKYYQMRMLLKRLELANKVDPLPFVLAGDFNSLPGSAVHLLVTEGWVDASHMDFQANYARPSPSTLFEFIQSSSSQITSSSNVNGSDELSCTSTQEQIIKKREHNFTLKSVYDTYENSFIAQNNDIETDDDENNNNNNDNDQENNIHNTYFTNFTHKFIGMIDYMFYEEDKWEVVNSRPLPARNECSGPLPDMHNPSDHVPLMATFKLKKSS